MRYRKRLVVATVSLLALAGAAVAVGETITVGNKELTVDGGVTPKKLPKKKMAPVNLNVEGHIKTTDGTTPPVTKKLVIDFDKNGKIDNKGLPVCKPQKLVNRNTKKAKKACKNALVGQGETRAIVDFPDQAPFDARGPLLAFNGPNKGKKKTIIFHVFAHVPAPTAFVVPGKISKGKGKFGTRVTIKVPTIAGGSGTLVDFQAKIGRKYKVKKKKKKQKKSYLVARCANKRFLANTQVFWADGAKADIGIVRKCKQK